MSSILPEHFLLEGGVAHRQHVVDDQDLGSRWAATAKARRTYIPEE